MLTYFLAWFLMLMIAIGNGTLREFVFKKHLYELKAHQLSTFSLLVFFSGFIFFLFKIFPPPTLLIAILVGIMWMALTEIFEFAFGLVRHLSWSAMLADYNISKGRLWLLVPVWLLVAPALFYLLMHNF